MPSATADGRDWDAIARGLTRSVQTGLIDDRRGIYRTAAKRYRSVARKIARGFFSGPERGGAFVSDVYERHYDQPLADYVQTRQQRRDVFRVGRRPVRANGWYTTAFHNEILTRLVDVAGAGRVLEVGSGRGENLVLLALRRPGLDLTGIELTAAGVAASRELASAVPPELSAAAGVTPGEAEEAALGRIDFRQASAFELPFEDDAFDVAFTCLVLEQIPDEYPKALVEMRRVTRGYCAFLEPFADANGPVGRSYLRSVDYFRARTKEFEPFGLEPVYFTRKIPQKLHFGTGLLVARVMPG